jgi:hypothetical protein
MVEDAYASWRSYRDSGSVQTRSFSPDGTATRVSERPFCTAFVRPDRFRFECRTEAGKGWNRYIVWARSSLVQTWWDTLSRAQEPQSLDLALAGATGISLGSAHTVAALLMPAEISGPRLNDLAGLELLGERAIDGRDCYQLSGRYPETSPEDHERARTSELQMTGRRFSRPRYSPSSFWIEKDTLLLRRIESRIDFETFRTETRTDYSPEPEVECREEELIFGLQEPIV